MVVMASAKSDTRKDVFPSLSTGCPTNSMVETPNYDGPLPQCQGPKLKPFPHRKSKVDFIRLLSDSESTGGIESGGHAHVFEVSIEGETYALKVVSYTPRRQNTLRSGIHH